MLTNTAEFLAPLLFDAASREAFATGLKALLREALELWSQAETCPERVLASTEGKGWSWGSYNEHDAAVKLTAAQTAVVASPEEPLMTLFPRVYSVTTSTTLHAGVALWPDQSITVAGGSEVKEQINRINCTNEKRSNIAWRRRLSVSNSASHHQAKIQLDSEPNQNIEK